MAMRYFSGSASIARWRCAASSAASNCRAAYGRKTTSGSSTSFRRRLLSQAVAANPVADRKNPRREARPGPKAAERTVGFDPGFLGRVLRIFDVAHRPVGEVVHGAFVPLDQAREGHAVAGLGGRDQCVIASHPNETYVRRPLRFRARRNRPAAPGVHAGMDENWIPIVAIVVIFGLPIGGWILMRILAHRERMAMISTAWAP